MILKIAVIGANKSGKTKLVQRLISFSFGDRDEDKQTSTIYNFRKSQTDSYEFTDTSGLLAQLDYLKNMDVILLVIDSTKDFNNQSFYLETIKKLAVEFSKELIIAISKIDLEQSLFNAQSEDVIRVTKNIMTFNVSSKTHTPQGVDDLNHYFDKLIKIKQSFFDLKTSLKVIIDKEFNSMWYLNLFGKKRVVASDLQEKIAMANTMKDLFKIIKAHSEYLESNRLTMSDEYNATQKCLLLCDVGSYVKVEKSPLIAAEQVNYGSCSYR